MRNLKKYKQNLRIENDNVISYSTIVAKIEDDMLIQLGWWSVTTQKHINYVAREMNLQIFVYENRNNTQQLTPKK